VRVSGTAVGVVPVEGRGSLPFLLYGGESLVALASWALTEAEVQLLDHGTSWAQVQDHGTALVIHDPLCPATPVPYLRALVERARTGPAVLVGVRPVTDTVKRLADGALGEAVDRRDLVSVASPVVLPAAVVADLPEWPDLTDLAALVERLAERFVVELVDAPPAARRLADASDLALLEALTG
jgi:2-C-methyl-D-erythritol 4-phosphate cytidylyltransferase